MPIRPFQNIAPSIAPSAYVDEAAVVIGSVTIGEDSSIWPGCVLRGDVNEIRVGARTNIQDASIIHVTHRSRELPDGFATTVGDDVTVGHRVILHGCTIESRCLVGMGSIVLDGAVLRSGVLLGAGSLVPGGKELEGGFLWVGQPAKKIRRLSEAEMARFDYHARHYVTLKNRYRV